MFISGEHLNSSLTFVKIVGICQSGAQVSEALNANHKYQIGMKMIKRVGRSSLTWASV